MLFEKFVVDMGISQFCPVVYDLGMVVKVNDFCTSERQQEGGMGTDHQLISAICR